MYYCFSHSYKYFSDGINNNVNIEDSNLLDHGLHCFRNAGEGYNPVAES